MEKEQIMLEEKLILVVNTCTFYNIIRSPKLVVTIDLVDLQFYYLCLLNHLK